MFSKMFQRFIRESRECDLIVDISRERESHQYIERFSSFPRESTRKRKTKVLWMKPAMEWNGKTPKWRILSSESPESVLSMSIDVKSVLSASENNCNMGIMISVLFLILFSAIFHMAEVKFLFFLPSVSVWGLSVRNNLRQHDLVNQPLLFTF